MRNLDNVWDDLYKKGLTWKKNTKGMKEELKNKSILELGVGNGKTLKSILDQNPKRIVAIDISEEAIKISSNSIKSDKVNFVKEDFINWDINDKFDVVVCYYFLNNFKEKQRRKAVTKMKSFLKLNGTILFEDFAVGDFRQKGKIIEKSTIQRKDGRICHFFEKKEILELFEDFKNVKIEEKTFSPIRKEKSVQRKIVKAIIKINALART